jgi:serine/threonine protein kinase
MEPDKEKSKKVSSYADEIFPASDLGNKYRIKKIIGKGSYGYVAKAVDKNDNSYVAIKKINNLFESPP